MEYKLAQKSDAQGILNLVQTTIKNIYPRYYLPEIVNMFLNYHCKENVIKDIESNHTYIVTDNDEILGTGTIIDNHITRLYVNPDRQRQGIGTYIMEQLENELSKKYDIANIDASLPAAKLYYKLGYITTDHGYWECENNVIQIYEIMEKKLRPLSSKNDASQMILRPYKSSDAKIIINWIKDETALLKWSSDQYGFFPIKPEDMNKKYFGLNSDNVLNEPIDVFPMTAVINDEVVGHLVLRYPTSDKSVIRLGFIIIDDTKRGQGYGKQLIKLALEYAFSILKVNKATLGVFDNNPSAYNCYKAAGFKEIQLEEPILIPIKGEKWRCIELEQYR